MTITEKLNTPKPIDVKEIDISLAEQSSISVFCPDCDYYFTHGAGMCPICLNEIMLHDN